jgi:hypothetical protein
MGRSQPEKAVPQDKVLGISSRIRTQEAEMIKRKSGKENKREAKAPGREDFKKLSKEKQRLLAQSGADDLAETDIEAEDTVKKMNDTYGEDLTEEYDERLPHRRDSKETMRFPDSTDV